MKKWILKKKLRNRSATDNYFAAASSKFSTRSGTSSSSSSSSSASPLAILFVAYSLSLPMLSGPNWFTMPGRSSSNLLVSTVPLTTYVFDGIDAWTVFQEFKQAISQQIICQRQYYDHTIYHNHCRSIKEGKKAARSDIIEISRMIYAPLGFVMWITLPSSVKILTSSKPFISVIPIFFNTPPIFLSSEIATLHACSTKWDTTVSDDKKHECFAVSII